MKLALQQRQDCSLLGRGEGRHLSMEFPEVEAGEEAEFGRDKCMAIMVREVLAA